MNEFVTSNALVSNPTAKSERSPVGSVVAVSRNPAHEFSKLPQPEIVLVAGYGVEGDAHFGATVMHRSRVRADASQPNLRQVHLIHEELLEELRSFGFSVSPGAMGENITTRGIDLLNLSRGTKLRVGRTAVIEVTGLRNPCLQLDKFEPGLMGAVLDRDSGGGLVRKAGIMAVVVESGPVRDGDALEVEFPLPPFLPLQPV